MAASGSSLSTMLPAAAFVSFCCLFISCPLLLADGCGITSHIEIGERSATSFNVISQGLNYKQLITRHPDAFQAGAPYPDAYYSGLCFGAAYHQESEDTHWTPFLNATVNYIRKHYQRPWDSATEKLVVFLFGVVQHQVADATWHSLGIDQGFLDTMGQVNFDGSFSAAHTVGDFGGDVLNVYELDMSYVGLVSKWYVPVDDLLNIYEELYGQPGRLPREVIENCTALLFLGRLGENLGVIDLLYPLYAEQSPFLLDSLNNYYLGGIDDMATWSANVWRRTIAMLDDGTQVCDLPDNPIYIRCNDERTDNGHRGASISQNSSHTRPDDDAFTRAVNRVNPDDILVRRTGRGIVYTVSSRLRRRIMTRLKMVNLPMTSGLQESTMQPDVVYSTRQAYSRLGQKLYSGDINGDGYDDLIVSAPEFYTADSAQQGRVYIVYGSVNGLPNRNLTIDTAANVIINGPLNVNGRFGMSTVIVDLNADGSNDLVVSAPSIGSQTLEYFGQVLVYLNNKETGTLPTNPSVIINCTERHCNLGWSLSVGDINGDGRKDLIIGSPFAPSGGRQRGMVGVLYSSPNFKDGDQLTEANFNLRWNGQQDYEWFGFSTNAASISSGEMWLAIGSPTFRICKLFDCKHDEDDIQSAGKVTVFRATTVGTGTPVTTITGTQEFEYFGSYVSVARYNGQDVISVSATSFEDENDPGRFNQTQAGLVRFHRIVANNVENEPWILLSGDRAFDRFGSEVLVYESQADGKSHVIVTSPFRSEDLLTDREGGRVYDLNDVDAVENLNKVTYSLNAAKSRFGSSVALIQGQGKQQLAIGASHYTTTLLRLAGQVAVVDL